MRPSLDDTFLHMARVLAKRATCARRAVGCVLVDVRNRIVATGYNGVPANTTHCTEFACPGSLQAPGKANLCRAIHAEQNAFVNAEEPRKVATVYCTILPCLSCAKLIVAAGKVRRVVCDTMDARDVDSLKYLEESMIETVIGYEPDELILEREARNESENG